MDIQRVYPQVAKIIADVLALNESDMTLNKRLIADLGAESIDFLDLIFQLENEFKIKIPRGQIEKEVRKALMGKPFEKEGWITTEGLQELKKYLNEVPETYFKPKLKVSEIPTLFTIETYCKLVIKAKINSQAFMSVN